ncbi:MAG: hypothetical protein GY810_20550 [Aureispira sp.]|nr:hypothetical protein [Aureispira sp.]
MSLITTAVIYLFLPLEAKWWCVVPLALATGAFVIRKGINEWWYTKFPLGLAKKEKEILNKFLPYYRNLDEEHKTIFEQRVAVFRVQKEYKMRGIEQVPGDIQLLMSGVAIQLTMGLAHQKEFYPELGVVVMFPKTFITPDYHEQLHAVEFNKDVYDCLLMSINMFVHGITKPKNYYNIGIHGFAKAWKAYNDIKDSDIPYKNTKELLVKLHQLRGFKLGYQFQYTALPTMEVFEMCVEHFFEVPEKMQEVLPGVYASLMNMFMQDPANRSNPIIQVPVAVPNPIEGEEVNEAEDPKEDDNQSAA